MLNKNHSHATLNRIASNAIHQLATLTIKVDTHLWAARFIKVRLGIGNTGTTNNKVFF